MVSVFIHFNISNIAYNNRYAHEFYQKFYSIFIFLLIMFFPSIRVCTIHAYRTWYVSGLNSMRCLRTFMKIFSLSRHDDDENNKQKFLLSYRSFYHQNRGFFGLHFLKNPTFLETETLDPSTHSKNVKTYFLKYFCRDFWSKSNTVFFSCYTLKIKKLFQSLFVHVFTSLLMIQ